MKALISHLKGYRFLPYKWVNDGRGWYQVPRTREDIAELNEEIQRLEKLDENPTD